VNFAGKVPKGVNQNRLKKGIDEKDRIHGE